MHINYVVYGEKLDCLHGKMDVLYMLDHDALVGFLTSECTWPGQATSDSRNSNWQFSACDSHMHLSCKSCDSRMHLSCKSCDSRMHLSCKSCDSRMHLSCKSCDTHMHLICVCSQIVKNIICEWLINILCNWYNVHTVFVQIEAWASIWTNTVYTPTRLWI